MKGRNELLIAARKKSGKTQREVAKRMGIAYQEYQRYEYGMNQKAIQTAIRIAKEYGMTVESIWGGNPLQQL